MNRPGSLALILGSALLVPSSAPAQRRHGNAEAVPSGRTSAAPPGQPASGPGSSAYAHARVRKNLYGEGALAFWLFEPADPRPASAPGNLARRDPDEAVHGKHEPVSPVGDLTPGGKRRDPQDNARVAHIACVSPEARNEERSQTRAI